MQPAIPYENLQFLAVNVYDREDDRVQFFVLRELPPLNLETARSREIFRTTEKQLVILFTALYLLRGICIGEDAPEMKKYVGVLGCVSWMIIVRQFINKWPRYL